MKITKIILSLVGGYLVSGCSIGDKVRSEMPPKENTQSNISSAQPEPLIMGQTYTIKSEVLGMDRRLTVRLPFYYDKEPARKFPVVYVIDGGPEQDFPHIAGIAQSRDINFTFEPFILVGIETVNRRYQITPPATDPVVYEKYLGVKPGGSADFRKYIRKEVMPWVEAKYRTNGQDAVIGESLGGLFITETFLKDPTLFDDYIAVSPSLWWDKMKLAKGASADLAAMPASKRRLYLTMADEAGLMQKGLDILIEAVEADTPDGLSWTYVERKNSEGHATIYHVAALDAFRAFYLSAGRTGGAMPESFSGGVVPPLTQAAKESMKQPCVRERAVPITYLEKNKDLDKWAAMCLIMKPGDTATKGNMDY